MNLYKLNIFLDFLNLSLIGKNRKYFARSYTFYEKFFEAEFIQVQTLRKLVSPTGPYKDMSGLTFSFFAMSTVRVYY